MATTEFKIKISSVGVARLFYTLLIRARGVASPLAQNISGEKSGTIFRRV